MNWNQMRAQWQQQDAATRVPDIRLLEQRDDALRATLKRRDRRETIAAVVVAAVFAINLPFAVAAGDWWRFAFALLLVASAAVTPRVLCMARGQGGDSAADVTLLQSLRGRHAHARAQARLLEWAGLWYVAPMTVGLVGLTLSVSGTTPLAIGYVVLVLAFSAFVAWLNWHVARRLLRPHAAQLQAQIDALSADG